MKKKILVLGATGLIGHQVFNYLKLNGQYELYNFAYRKKLQDDTLILDARDEGKLLEKFILAMVNCVETGPNITIKEIAIANTLFFFVLFI